MLLIARSQAGVATRNDGFTLFASGQQTAGLLD
jgi:hypothetical protein